MQVEVLSMRRLWFRPGDPVRAASAIAQLGGRWLIAQDDANHAGWWDPTSGLIERVRLLPPVRGLDLFSEAQGTKRLKPDLEAACTLPTGEGEAVALLGSGSLPPRTRGVLVRASPEGAFEVRSAGLAPLYEQVAAALGLNPTQLNLEGACLVSDRLRWFQRGHGPTGVPSASVDVSWRQLVAALHHEHDPAQIAIDDVRRYDLGNIDGVTLSITDAATLDDGRIVVSATAEDAPDAIADGPVAGSVLALLGEGNHAEILPLPDETVGCKIEGLAPFDLTGGRSGLLAVVDDDNPTIASLALELALTEPSQ